jgi:hypothetical protein
VRKIPAFQPFEKFDRVPRREDHGTRLGDGILNFDNQATEESERLLVLDWPGVKTGMTIR